MTIDPNSIIGKAGMSEMEIQQARANAILADFAAGVSMGTVPDLQTHLGIGDVAPPVAKWTTESLIESAEILKRSIVEAEQALEAELAPMRAKLKEAEDALRAKALEQGESIKGAHIQVQIVAPSATVKWDDKGLSGAVAMLPENWKAAILAHRKTDEKPASTRIVYK